MDNAPSDSNNSMLTADSLAKELKTKVLGRGIVEIHDSIDSTNTRAKVLAHSGAGEGSIILAESQTAGKGRLGRTWHSPPGLNIYVSILLRPTLAPNRTPLLTLASGLASASAVQAVTGLNPQVKWPNDLLIGRKKFVGILSEMETTGHKTDFVILGIGMNVNMEFSHFPPDLSQQATSIKIETGETSNRILILAAMFQEIEQITQELESGNLEQMLDNYRKLCINLGERVAYKKGPHLFKGTALDIDQSGALVVELDNGDVQSVNAGEVSLMKDSL